jgi:hypothetical protein
MSITIDVAFRYDKKWDRVEMFYYDEHKELVCFSREGGHGVACYEYYLSCKPIDTKNQKQMDAYRAIAKYYVDDDTKIRVMKRLKYRECSYA